MTFAFRVDSSTRIGTGHLVRCLTLAKHLRSRGVEVIFLCQHLEGDTTALVEQAGFEVMFLNIGNDGHASSQNRDAIESLRLIHECSATRVVLDHYDLSLEWEELVAGNIKSLMVIDDFTDRRHRCDLLLNQNLVPPRDSSFSVSPHGATRALVGPKFALLQHEYAAIRSIRSMENSPIDRISVFMGGSDPENVTELVLRSLVNMELGNIAIDVVIGAANPHHAQLLSLFGDYDSIIFHTDLTSLAPLLTKSDLAIGAGGTSNWERMCLGVPSIVVDIAENQRGICIELARAGFIEHIGSSHSISSGDIQHAVEKLISQTQLRSQYSRQGQIAVDGLGANRVNEILLPSDQTSLTLRNRQVEDIFLYFNWVNESMVRQSSIQSEPISWSEHEAWFMSRINSSTCMMYVICANDLPIGQVRFEKDGEAWAIDYSLDEFIRGRGWGHAVVELGLAELRKSTTGKLVANVKTTNIASQQIFKRLGFSTTAQSGDAVEQFVLMI